MLLGRLAEKVTKCRQVDRVGHSGTGVMHLDKRGEEAHGGGGTMKAERQLELES